MEYIFIFLVLALAIVFFMNGQANKSRSKTRTISHIRKPVNRYSDKGQKSKTAIEAEVKP